MKIKIIKSRGLFFDKTFLPTSQESSSFGGAGQKV
jgi:hypothetical protein